LLLFSSVNNLYEQVLRVQNVTNLEWNGKGGRAWLPLPSEVLYLGHSSQGTLNLTVATLGPAHSKGQAPRQEGSLQHRGREQHLEQAGAVTYPRPLGSCPPYTSTAPGRGIRRVG